MQPSAQRIRVFFYVLSVIASAALGQNNRSAVSVNGSDVNPCTTVSPCRSFTTAMGVTNPGGEVIAFDSGGYGSFTISKSVSVIGAPGVHAALTSSASDGLDVAAMSTDTVKIRNLAITLTGTTNIGIYATSFAFLTIENCTVSGGLHGLRISGSPTSQTTIVDTSARVASNVGFYIESRTSLIRCRAEGNANVGLYVQNGAAADGNASASDFAAVANNIGVAAFTNAASGHKITLNLDRAMISNNVADGISSNSTSLANAIVRVTNSMITDNGQYGFHQSNAGTLETTDSNLVRGNLFTDIVGTITIVEQH